ncbi:hypothetical protein ANO11243_035410 [Dothideomycetidae sp. 11243]|nr:hypothetical protein ANO11243_035410 [fungal sp. No.11243]
MYVSYLKRYSIEADKHSQSKVTDPRHLHALCSASKRLYNFGLPKLYHDVHLYIRDLQDLRGSLGMLTAANKGLQYIRHLHIHTRFGAQGPEAILLNVLRRALDCIPENILRSVSYDPSLPVPVAIFQSLFTKQTGLERLNAEVFGGRMVQRWLENDDKLQSQLPRIRELEICPGAGMELSLARYLLCQCKGLRKLTFAPTTIRVDGMSWPTRLIRDRTLGTITSRFEYMPARRHTESARRTFLANGTSAAGSVFDKGFRSHMSASGTIGAAFMRVSHRQPSSADVAGILSLLDQLRSRVEDGASSGDNLQCFRILAFGLRSPQHIRYEDCMVWQVSRKVSSEGRMELCVDPVSELKLSYIEPRADVVMRERAWVSPSPAFSGQGRDPIWHTLYQ